MHHHNPTKRKNYRIVYTLALSIISIMLAVGFFTKITSHPDAVDLFSRLNLLPYMKSFGIIQLILMVCLWWKPTRIMATLILSAYFGAGVVMMFSAGENALMSTLLLLLTWIVHKCSWWSMWEHGYHCSCPSCSFNNTLLPKDKKYCACGRPGCWCEEGKCECR